MNKISQRFISNYSIKNNTLSLLSKSGEWGTLHTSWLRDHCPCPLCLHPTTRQKLHSSADVSLTASPKSISIEKETMIVEWDKNSLDSRPNDFHSSRYSIKDLKLAMSPIGKDKASSSHRHTPGRGSLSRVEWNATTFNANPFHTLEYKEILEPNGFKRMLLNLKEYGLTFIKNAPIQEENVSHLANKIGPIRNTFYGPTWDVKSVVHSKNIAYTSLYLTLHMDLMYFECPPGIQFLYSLQNNVNGGESIFLDSFKAVSILRELYPEDYKVLKEFPVTFQYKNDGHYMSYKRPTIIEDPLDDQGLQVYYAPPFQGPLTGDQNRIQKFYKSFKVFQRILHDPSLLYKLYLSPGMCVVFANRRVLHGRLEFDASSGSRHFKGTYVDYDDFKDKLRIHELFYYYCVGSFLMYV